MERYLPGAVLALCGLAVYAIGGALFLADRRQRGRDGANKSLFVYSMILMVLSATVGASIISRDVRHRALLMYFSRSITRADYLLGKFLALVLFLLLVTLGPGLLLFLGQLGMSQERLTFGLEATLECTSLPGVRIRVSDLFV